MTNTLSHIAKVVIAAGLTTVAGFVSLLLTPSDILQRLGALIIFGIVAALISSLTLLPPMLVGLEKPIDRARNANRSSRSFGAPVERSEPRRPVLRLALGGAIVAVFLIAAPFIRGGYSTRDAFRAGSQVDQTVRYFEERTEASQQMEIALYTDEQYGLVSLDAYREIRAMEERLEGDGTTRHVTSYGDFVEWLLGRLTGSITPVAPESDADIGEAMELLSGEGVGQIFEALVDPNWQSTRMLLQVDFPRIGSARSGRTAEQLIEQMQVTATQVPAVSEAVVIGEPMANIHHIEYLARSQMISIVVFLPILVVFLMIAFRSFAWALVTLLPTIVAITVYFGTVTLLGFLHDPIHVFMVAGLMGVSNDDVLYFIIVFRDEARSHPFTEALLNTMRRTGVAIVQTTLIIVGGVATFYFSDFVLMARAGLVATVALIAASAVTLFAIPAILKLSPRMVERLSSRPPTLTEAELQ
jgi:predicted RND superfamily exporter protein